MKTRLFSYVRRPTLIIAACLALGAGVVLARFAPDLSGWIVLGLPPFLLVSLRRHNIATLFWLVLLCFLLGWWRGGLYAQQLARYDALYGQKVTLVGHAAEEAVYGEQYQLEFTLDQVRATSPEPVVLPGIITVRGYGEPAIYRGDIVQVQGKLYPTLGNSVARISYAQLTTLGNHSNFVDVFRRKFAAAMQSALPEPAASFALGLLIGQRNTLPDHVSEALRVVGLTHIIAVSGYNLTVIVEITRRLFANRSKFQATVACVVLVGLFLLVTGTSPSIVRASIISMLSLAVWYYGRAIKPMVLLLVSGAITLLMNPSYLWGNVSWYLSFLAFFGVLILAPLLTARLFGERKPPLLAQVLIETICASVLTVPYILYIFGQTSLVALPANLLVVPLIPLAMLLGLTAGLAGMFAAPIAGWLTWPATTLLTYMLDAATLLARVPHALVEHIAFGIPQLAFSYAVIAWICLILQRRKTAMTKQRSHTA